MLAPFKKALRRSKARLPISPSPETIRVAIGDGRIEALLQSLSKQDDRPCNLVRRTASSSSSLLRLMPSLILLGDAVALYLLDSLQYFALCSNQNRHSMVKKPKYKLLHINKLQSKI